jgi:hypothetical protein
MDTRWPKVTHTRIATLPRMDIRSKPPRTTRWVVLKPSRNDCQRRVGATFKNNNEIFEDCCTPPLLNHHENGIVESGCTDHYVLINAPCRNKLKSISPLHVRFPNGVTIDSTHNASLNIPELSESASVAHFFSDMENTYLLLVCKLCNAIYSFTLKSYGVTLIINQGIPS